MRRVRRRYRIPLLAAVVAALVVPVGFALSLSSGTAIERREVQWGPASPAASVSVPPPVILISEPEDQPWSFGELSDSAKLFVVGTLLVGFAAAMRKAV